MNPLLPVSSISQINDFENYFQLFFKIFYGSSIYRKRNNKELFFLMIGADDFQITAGGDYSVPAVKTPCPAAAGRSGFRRFI